MLEFGTENSRMKRFLFFWLSLIIAFLVSINVKTCVSASEDEVVELSIVSDKSLDETLGTHAFLYIYNISDDNITIFDYTLKPNEGMTVGTWHSDNKENGIYINYEAYLMTDGEHSEEFKDYYSLTVELDSSQLNTLIASMKKHNEWTVLHNCSYFASKVWNDVCPKDKKLSAGLIATPKGLINNIKKKEEYSYNKAFVFSDNLGVRSVKRVGSSSSWSSMPSSRNSSSS